MSLLIKPRHHGRFRRVLEDSFRLRREVFVERLGWSLPHADRTAGTGLEYDDFDGNAATYLVNVNSAAQVIATVRITPSTTTNLSCDVLGPQMGIVMPRGPHIVEMSRMCADPRLSREERRGTMLELRACTGLLFLENGWTHCVGVGYDHHIQPYISSGMTVEVLGPPMIFPGDKELSFAVMATDPDRPSHVAQMLPGRLPRLQDPDRDPSLIARYGDRAASPGRRERSHGQHQTYGANPQPGSGA